MENAKARCVTPPKLRQTYVAFELQADSKRVLALVCVTVPSDSALSPSHSIFGSETPQSYSSCPLGCRASATFITNSLPRLYIWSGGRVLPEQNLAREPQKAGRAAYRARLFQAQRIEAKQV